MRKIIFTGESKGKTTGAVGILLSYAVRGFPCLFIQFLKGGRFTGEILLLQKYDNIKTLQLGKVSIFSENIRDGKRAPGTECFGEIAGYSESLKKENMNSALNLINAKEYSIIVLDEVITAYWLKQISIHDVKSLMQAAEHSNARLFLCTGRGSDNAISNLFDEVLYFKPEKHPFQEKGLVGRYGIEY